MNATLRKVGALAGKDLADLFKNPTMLVVLLGVWAMIMLKARPQAISEIVEREGTDSIAQR